MSMFKGIGILVLIVIGILGAAFYHSTSNIHKLFTENYRLSKAIHNLTQEQQIGYAVLEEQTRDQSGRVLNTLSHGQGILSYFQGRLRVKGIYSG